MKIEISLNRSYAVLRAFAWKRRRAIRFIINLQNSFYIVATRRGRVSRPSPPHVGADYVMLLHARVCVCVCVACVLHVCECFRITAVSNACFYQCKLILISVILTLHLFLILIIRKKEMKSQLNQN